MKKKNMVLILALAGFFSLNSGAMDDKGIEQNFMQLRTYLNDVFLPPHLQKLALFSQNAKDVAAMIAQAQYAFGMIGNFSADDATMAQDAKDYAEANVVSQQKIIDLAKYCMAGAKQPEDLAKLREDTNTRLKNIANKKALYEQLPNNTFAKVALQQIKHRIVIFEDLLSSDVLGSKEKPGMMITCAHPAIIATAQRVIAGLKAPSASASTSAGSAVVAQQASHVQTPAQQFKKNYPALAKAFNIDTFDLAKQAAAVDLLLEAMEGQFGTDNVETLEDAAQLKSLKEKYKVQFNELISFVQSQEKNMNADDFKDSLKKVEKLNGLLANEFGKKDYPALAKSSYNFEDFDIKPWNATSENAQKVADEIFTFLNNALSDFPRMGESQRKSTQENYNKELDELKNFIQSKLSAVQAPSMLAKVETLRKQYEAYIKTIESARGADKREKSSPVEKPIMQPSIVQPPVQAPSKPIVQTQTLPLAKLDPNWSEALGKQEQGNPITITNATNRPLWVAVYERMKGRQPKRYGDAYKIEAKGFNKDIRRPDWSLSQRASNDRFLYFSENKDDLALGVDHGKLGSIGIGEGSGWSSKKDFTISSDDLKK